MSSPQMANLLNKTAAAAEEFKRLLSAEQGWAEERSTLQQDVAKKAQDLDKLQAKCRRLEELRASEVAAWRKERDAGMLAFPVHKVIFCVQLWAEGIR